MVPAHNAERIKNITAEPARSVTISHGYYSGDAENGRTLQTFIHSQLSVSNKQSLALPVGTEIKIVSYVLFNKQRHITGNN